VARGSVIGRTGEATTGGTGFRGCQGSYAQAA